MIEIVITIRAIPLEENEEVQEQLVDGLYEQIESPDQWDFKYEATGSDPLEEFIERFVDEELAEFTTTKPATSKQYGDVLVVLDYIQLTAEDAGIEYKFTLETGDDLETGRTGCENQVDSETGLAAEKFHDDEKIGAGLQRTADGLDHSIEWVNPISPRDLSGVAEAAIDLFEDE